MILGVIPSKTAMLDLTLAIALALPRTTDAFTDSILRDAPPNSTQPVAVVRREGTPRSDRDGSGTPSVIDRTRYTPPNSAPPTFTARRTRGGDRDPSGTRGPCDESDIPFTPLLPVTPTGFTAKTLSEYPTLWFYVPYRSDRVKNGTFSLDTLQGKRVYLISFQLPQTPGFVSIKLPNQKAGLQPNQSYRWHMQLNCASSRRQKEVNFVFHKGVITRIPQISLESRLKQSLDEDIKLITFYKNHEIWDDAFTKATEPKPISTVWTSLLQAVGLEELSNAPMAGAVTITEVK